MTDIQIFSSNGSPLILAPITDKSKHEQELMKTDQIHLEWSDTQNIALPLGAYISYLGKYYYINRPYYPESKDSGRFSYKVDFVHEIMLLKGIPFMLHTPLEDGTEQVESDWNYTGSIQDLAPTLKTAINKALNKPQSSQYDISIEEGITKAVSLSFSNVDILSALNSIVNEIEGEWWIDTEDSKVIKIGKKCIHEGGETTTLELTAGEQVDYPSSNNRADFYNRFYVFGGTRNIPQDYQGAQANRIINKRLTLSPMVHPDGSMLLPYYDVTGNIEISLTERSGFAPFLDEDGQVKYYKVDESVTDSNKVFTKVIHLDDIYPRADLRVSHIATRSKFVRDDAGNKVETANGFSTYNIYYVQLVNTNGEVFSFDPKTYSKKSTGEYEGDVIKNLTPSIHFNTGALTGREFEIVNHFSQIPQIKNETDGSDVSFSGFETIKDKATIFELKVSEDGTITIPNTGIEPTQDDEAIVFNIRMPQTYIDKGYIDLEREALKQIYELSKDGNEYSVKSNQLYFYENDPMLSLGKHVHLYVNERLIDTRVTKLTTYLDKTFNQEISFCKAISKGSIQTILTSIEDTRQQVIQTQAEDTFEVKQARKAIYEANEELKNSIFDTDGYFKDGNLKPETIETLMVQVGGKSTQFELGGFTMIPNIEGETINANFVSWTSGVLTHFGFDELMEWNIQPNQTRLSENALHYIYAKCVLYDPSSFSRGTGTIEITTEKIPWDKYKASNNVYYFLIGTISSINATTSQRVVSLTYGSTTINGEYLKTGVIRSNNGKMEINLNNGEIWSEDGVTFTSGGKRKSLSTFETETQQGIQDANDKVDNIKVGGVNLWAKSRLDSRGCFSPTQYLSGSLANVHIVEDAEMGLVSEFYETNGTSIRPFTLKANTEYTISWYAKCSRKVGNKEDECCKFRQLFGSTDLKNLVDLGSGKGTVTQGITIVARDNNPDLESSGCIIPVDMEWHRYYAVIKVDEVVASKQLTIRWGIMQYSPDTGSRGRFCRIQLEEGNKVTEWREAQADIDERTQAKIAEINDGIQQQLKDLESQIDDEIEYYFDNYVPTATNAPANAWTTDELKKAHIGDIFYRNDEGTSYKWVRKDNVYQWLFLENDPSAKAMALAQQALTEVGDKNAVIYGTTPKPPYQKGDMWSRGGSEPLLICATSRDSGSFVDTDWVDATSYIDNVARETANTAVNAAESASSKVDNLKIGGRNYELGTSKSFTAYSNSSSSQKTWTNNSGFYTPSEFLPRTKGTKWAISFDYECNISSGYCDFAIHDIWKGIIRFNSTTNGKSHVEFVYELTANVTTKTALYMQGTFVGSVIISNLMLEEGNKCSNWQQAPEDVDAQAQAYAESVRTELTTFSNTVTGSITNLQAQVDGKIETWFYEGVPTTSNAPAKDWSATDKSKHIDDLYYDTKTNKSYRWNGTAWVDITRTDPDVATALANAKSAQDTADGKRRIFLDTPIPPYDKGDMWSGGASGDLKVCQTARKSGSYTANDWVLASKYTDDTYAKNIQIGGRNLLLKSDTSYSSTASTTSYYMPYKLTDFGKANIKTGEKVVWSFDYSHNITSGRARIQTDIYKGSDGARAMLVDITSSTATSGRIVFVGSVGDIVSLTNSALYVEGSSRTGSVTITNVKLELGNKATDWDKAPEDIEASIKDAKDLAQTAKDNAMATDEALKAVDSDGIFSTIEKRTMRPQWQAIYGTASTSDSVGWTDSGSAYNVYNNAINAGFSSTESLVKAQFDAVIALRKYLNAVGLYSDSNFTFTSSYTRAQLSTKFQDYHKAEVALSEATANKLANTAKENAISTASADATAKANKALSDAKDYAKAQADAAAKKAEDLAFLKNAFEDAKDGETKVIGGLSLGEMMATKDASTGKVTALMNGKSTDANSIAFAAGRDVLGEDAPFKVRHDGSVEMSKASITSGTNALAQVNIHTKNNGEVGAISVGSAGGADTEIVGEASGGIDGMLTKAGVGMSSSSTSLSAGSAQVKATITDKAYLNYTGYSGQPYTITNATKENYTDTTIMSAKTKAGTLTLGNFSASKVGNVTIPTASYAGSATTGSTSLVIEVSVRVMVYVGGVIRTGTSQTFSIQNGSASGNINTLNGKKVTFNAGESVVLRTYTEMRVTWKTVGTIPTTGGTATATGGSAEYKVDWTAGSYSQQTLNNILYNDGMFMSRATDKYIAFSPVGNDMIRAKNGLGAGIELTPKNFSYLANNASMPIGKMLFFGTLTYNNGYTTANNLGNGVTLAVQKLTTGRYKLTLGMPTNMGKVTDYHFVYDVRPASGWVTNMRYLVSDVATDGSVILSSTLGSSQTDFHSGNSYQGSNTSASSMSVIRIQIIYY